MKTAIALFVWAIVILGSAFADKSYAARIWEQDSGVIVMEGVIKSGDALKLLDIIKNKEQVDIQVHSRGGNAVEGLELNRVMQEHGNVAVHIAKNKFFADKCQSACAIAAIGAKRVYGTLAFHKAFYKKSKLTKSEEYLLRKTNSHFKTLIIKRFGMKVWAGVEKTNRYSFQTVDMFGQAFLPYTR